MRELDLVGLHDDGEHLILADAEGTRYTIPLTEALRAAVRRDRSALSLLQASGPVNLRPRDIQAMFRSGHDAEEIAEIADCAVDHVKRFEGPVIAERAWIAEKARGYHVGRGGGPTLDEIVAERLAARHADPSVSWDAWRRDDGTWTVELSFTAARRSRIAHWTVDPARESIAPEDDEASWLTEDGVSEPDEDRRHHTRLTSVKNRIYDVEADGGVDEPAPEDDSAPPRLTPVRPSRDGSRADEPDHDARTRGRRPGTSPIDDAQIDQLNARRGVRPDDTESGEPLWRTPAEDERESDRRAARRSHPSAHGDEDSGPRWPRPLRPVPTTGADTDEVDGSAPHDGAEHSDADSDAAANGPEAAAPTPAEADAPDVPGAPDAPDARSASDADEAPEDAAEDTSGVHPGTDASPTTPSPASPGSADSPDRAGDAGLPGEMPLPGFDDAPGSAGGAEQPENGKPTAARSGNTGTKRSKSSKSKRADMPSWDEIVFGSKPHE